MKNFLSRYNLKYPRGIVYMLQSSEYNIPDFLTWYHRTHNFLSVEKRGKLNKTKKAKILLVCGWIILLSFYVNSLSYLFSTVSMFTYLIFILEIIIAPYLLPYLILIPVYILNLIQKPIENKIIFEAKKKLKNHKGYKIAIAGSYGKTTMREILKNILSVAKKVATTEHNFNTPIGISRFVTTLDGSEEVLIFEFGEYYKGDIKKLCEFIEPDLGIITGVNEAHLSRFKTIENTVKTIFELSDHLQNKILYVNSENELSKNNAPKGSIFYNSNGVGNLKIANQKTDLDGTTFTVIKDNESVAVFSKLLGLHQIGPLAVASDIAFNIGLDLGQIKSGISKTKPFKHRLEPKSGPNGSIFIDDSYNGNPDGVKAIINFLSSLEGRKIFITPGLVETGSKTEEIHKNIGKLLVEADVEKVILIKNYATIFIEQGLKESDFKGEIVYFKDMPKALDALNHMTVDGDIVLIQNDLPDQYV